MMCRTAPVVTTGVALVSASACVIPVPLERENADAGPTSPPVILSASPTELSFPGPVELQQGDQRRLGLTIRDQDREDTLYIKIFVDYALPDQDKERTDCVVPPSDSELRAADCSVQSICNDALADGELHLMEAMVSDREFLPDNDPRTAGQPPFRAVPEDAAFSFRSWMLRCAPEPLN